MSNFDGKPVTAQGQDTKGLNVIAAGEVTVDATDIDIAAVGVLATDIVVVSLHTQAGTADLADLTGKAEADNINITVTAKGDDTGVVSYIVVRP